MALGRVTVDRCDASKILLCLDQFVNFNSNLVVFVVAFSESVM